MKVAVLLLIMLVAAAVARAQPPSPPPPSSWAFAVSGDSRNCGDVIMPSIAEGAHKYNAVFYWHLGDFRHGLFVDEDMNAAGEISGHEVHRWEYPWRSWSDFIDNQLKPFGPIPVFLTIGNHELVRPKSRAKYLKVFAPWVDREEIRKQRRSDDPHDDRVKTYYHWVRSGVDFIALDNASTDQFSEAQVAWFEQRLASAARDPAIKTLVVGMHAALPDSLGAGHSMNDWQRGVVSGRRVYADLVRWQTATGKKVYVLASHSHFYMEGVFHTVVNERAKTELPGWIVGTGGARRYRLPEDKDRAKDAKTDVYGYMIGTVQADGGIEFKFHEVKEGDLSGATKAKYGAAAHECFVGNKDEQVNKR